MDLLLAALLAWVSPVLGLPVPTGVPTLRLAAHCDIQALAYDDASIPCTEDGVQALYLPEADTIYLPDDWDPTDILDVSMLVHELGHYAQDKAGRLEDIGCMLDVEWPAYEAQAAFLESAGVEHAWEAMQVDPLFLAIAYQCVPDYASGYAPR